MKLDITEILNEWDYDPDNHIRVLRLKDGREIIQVRQPLGIEQYELEGRPDGKHPFNKESVLREFLDRLEYHKLLFTSDDNFRLSRDDFLLLQDEGMLYYARYLILYQIGDFERTAKDTEHNLKICELVDRFLEEDDYKNELLQYRPYILRMNALSNAMIQMQKKLKGVAKEILKSAIDFIQNIPVIDTPTFKIEKSRALETLRMTLLEISDNSLTDVEKLQMDLEKAVESENYEKAAEIRDKINRLKGKKESNTG
ncbi:MAG: UvrB/UvrC motif-containing protein [Spirochaetales bacterium]|nr:UvrB/UvrC motif-containing protein [Spirochaetales bacterium]